MSNSRVNQIEQDERHFHFVDGWKRNASPDENFVMFWFR